MNSPIKLKDGVDVQIRPLKSDDLERSLTFFKSLRDEDRAYLRRDVRKPEVVEQRIRALESGQVQRLVAIVDDQIVAEGSLELEGHGWKEHVGELRLIVSPHYQRKGLGMLMARELYALAANAKVEEMIVKMMRPQTAARHIFRKLGFHEEILLPDYVKDITGRRQDLVVMRCDLQALWEELEHFISAGDWQRAR